ncbi:MAG TPA: ribonuclease Z [Bacteroidales bacterium]|nr:ribonuclease Z [Bacteroidales bacterium]
MEFKLLILGSSSALPTVKRNLPAQILSYNNKPFLIDCGEGTQLQLRKHNISFNKIDHIFISHLHGDHFYGIFGFLGTMGLLGRKKPLHIFSPYGLEEIINSVFEKTNSEIPFPIKYHILNTKQPEIILTTKWLEINSFPLKHSKPVCGFIFKEKEKPANIIKEKIEEYNIGISEIVKIKNGAKLKLASGKEIENSELVYPKPKLRSYAYCTDTKFVAKNYKPLKDIDVLYHEATFAEADKQTAHNTGHSTATEAAKAAIEINAKLLLLGHFSSRYKTNTHIIEEAKSIFKNTIGVEDGDYFEI